MSQQKLGDVFKRLRHQRGLVMKEVEVQTGGKIQPGPLSRIENNGAEPLLQTAWMLAKTYNASLDEIMQEVEGAAARVAPRMPVFSVPLLSPMQLEQLREAPKADDYADRPTVEVVQLVTEQAFAFQVVGDAMTGAAGMGFPEGYVVIADPGIEPEHGDFVLVYTKNRDTLFRQLVVDMGRYSLRALNHAYTTVAVGKAEDFTVLGVVVGALWWTPNLRNRKF